MKLVDKVVRKYCNVMNIKSIRVSDIAIYYDESEVDRVSTIADIYLVLAGKILPMMKSVKEEQYAESGFSRLHQDYSEFQFRSEESNNMYKTV